MNGSKPDVNVKVRKNKSHIGDIVIDLVNKIIRIIIYVRVSTDEQAERNTSLENQLDKCREYAKEHGLEVIMEFREDYTGTSISRPELTKAMMMLKEGKADGMICMTVDRLAQKYMFFRHL